MPDLGWGMFQGAARRQDQLIRLEDRQTCSEAPWGQVPGVYGCGYNSSELRLGLK